VSGRIAVGVSGMGSNLRALHAAAVRGELGGTIALVFADRDCPAIEWAAKLGIETAVIPGGDDTELAARIARARTDVVVLAGYMRLVGPAVLATYTDRILNVHPSLLPAFPGAHAVRDALRHGSTISGATVHLVDETLDGGPIVAQEAVPILHGDDEAGLQARIQAVEHRLLPRVVALLLAGAVLPPADGRRMTIDLARADERLAVPRRALLSVSDKTGLADLGHGLVRRGFELVSTGGTAKVLRDAGLPVTDVASVTGFPEMLDGRIKTLHPRVHGGILADRRLADHRRQLLAAAIAPFELVVVNLYPFAAAAERPGISLDELVEEIDIGGPAMVRAAAKNHANVAIVTAPGRYPALLAAIEEHGSVPDGLRAALAVEAFGHTAAYDARIAAELSSRIAAAGVSDLPRESGAASAHAASAEAASTDDPYPQRLTIELEKVETLRYGENPHQAAARYVRADSRTDGRAADGPFSTATAPLQGKQLSYNNVLDASAAAAIARRLDGPACVIVKHTNPCGAAERASLADAWAAALAGDPVSAFGGVVALTDEVDRATADGLAGIFLEVVVAPGFSPAAREILASKPNLRLLVDESIAVGPASSPDPLGSIRSAGGAVLVTAPDTAPDDPDDWQVCTTRHPTDAEWRDLQLAWRLVRGVTSNAIVLVRDGALIGLGSGQTSRVDAARQAVEKARAISGEAALRGASCASDAFYPFPDGVDVCLATGVTAFVQPGGSMRDADVIGAAENAGATMLLTGVRHFRH
jgi:phosphoribosylaminoimidazolecarboxamide formyltransferase/IMP cyclohydrolase